MINYCSVKPWSQFFVIKVFLFITRLYFSNQNVSTDYDVKKGDSLFSIAKKYPSVTISDLKKWNGIRSEDIKPGMKLKING